MILHMNLSSEEQFLKYSYKQRYRHRCDWSHVRKGQGDCRRNATIRTTTAAYIHHLNTVVNIMLPLLADRHWCVLRNDAANANLIVTDNPVGITWSDGHRPGNLFDIPAFGSMQTDVSIPIGHASRSLADSNRSPDAGNGCAGCRFNEYEDARWLPAIHRRSS